MVLRLLPRIAMTLLGAVIAFSFSYSVERALAVQTAPASTGSCLSFTAGSKPNASLFLSGLGLTAEQIRELRARLSRYDTVFTGFKPSALAGVGLTADQLSAITRRIATWVAANTHPAGWPCAPFKNQARVVKYTRAKLLYNGFRPSMTFSTPSTRQIQFVAIQDGQKYWGTVAKFGPRQIKAQLTCTQSCTTGGTFTFNLSFEA